MWNGEVVVRRKLNLKTLKGEGEQPREDSERMSFRRASKMKLSIPKKKKRAHMIKKKKEVGPG